MSFAVTVLDAITVTPETPQPPAGETVVLTADFTTGTVAITDPDSATTPVVFQLDQSFVSGVGTLIDIAIATAGAQIVIDGSGLPSNLSSASSVQITVGKNENGDFLQIGGMVISGSSANGLTISLAGGLATIPVPTENIPEAFKKIFQFGLTPTSFLNTALSQASLKAAAPVLNTATELSRGNDSFLGTQFNDGVVLSKGKDTMVGGGGTDIFVADSSIAKAKLKITLEGTGDNDSASGLGDQLILAKATLKKGDAKIVLSDFNNKEDSVLLQAKRKDVEGIGTDKMKVSTKDGKQIIIRSDDTKFTRRSVEFI